MSQWPANGARQSSYVRSLLTTDEKREQERKWKTAYKQQIEHIQTKLLLKFVGTQNCNHNIYIQNKRQKERKKKEEKKVTYVLKLYSRIQHYHITDILKCSMLPTLLLLRIIHRILHMWKCIAIHRLS
jgi:hypothetical protein